MDNIYKKIKTKYSDYKILNNKDEEMIEISKNEVKVKIFKDTILLFVNDKCVDHFHTADINREDDLYGIVEYYLKDYKKIIEQYRKQDIIKKMLFIIPMVMIIIGAIILICVEYNRRLHFYDNLKDNMQNDIERVLYLLYPHCQVGSANPGLLLEESQNNYYGIDNKKLLDIDGKSYCKIKVKTKCVEDSKLNWETYIKCKDYEDKGFN